MFSPSFSSRFSPRAPKPPRRAALGIAVALLSAAFSGHFARAQQLQSPTNSAPLAGTTISNRAYVTFETEGQPVRLDSDTVFIQVAGVPGVALSPSLERRVSPGAPVSLAHRLTNSGNIATAYTLQITALTGDSYDLQNARVALDANSNGTFDIGETLLPASTPVFLNPGQSADLVLFGEVPAATGPDAVSRTRLTATVSGPAPGAPSADFPALSASVQDTLTNAAGASVAVSKSASVAQSQPGGEITFSVIARNAGTVSPLPQNIQVDGALRQFVLLRDLIPANTELLELLPAPVGGLRLFHRIGDGPDSFVTAPPALNLVNGVAIAVPSLQAQSAFGLSFRVKTGPIASGQIANVANFGSLDALTGAVSNTPSNQILISLPILPPTLLYYTNSNYLTPAGATSIGRPLFLQGAASASNRDAGAVEVVRLTLKSTLTGDMVIVDAVETGPNTGVFRVRNPIPTSGGAVDTSDATLSIRANDTLEATIEDMVGARAVADILVDPAGVVFDARTNVPVAGARVTLIDVTGAGNGGKPGAPARVFDFDGTTPAPATVVTGADGTFGFSSVAGSVYRLEITPPDGFSFASKISRFLLPQGRRIDETGSFGGSFRVDGVTGAVQIDVPVDGAAPGGLFVQKVASRRTAEIADVVDYEIRVRNATGSPLAAASVRDTLPRGFGLVQGSAKRDGAAIANPTGAPGPALTFPIGPLAPDAETRFTYRVRIGAGVSSGENRNRALATGTTLFGPITSNTAVATVRVSAGVLTERGIIFGKVFIDSNKNRVQDEKIGTEVGIPGVRVWIEDGTFAITDSDGKYSIYGLSARTHVVKTDPQTLPAGTVLSPLTVRHGGRGDSAFADLQKGELHKVNFAVIDATPALLAQIEKRRAAGDPFGAEVSGTLQTDLRRTTDDVTPDSRSLPSTGTVGASGAIGTLSAPASTFDTLNPRANGIVNTSPNGNNATTFDAGGNVFVPRTPGNTAAFPFGDTDRSPGSLLPPGAQNGAPKTAIGPDDLAGFEASLKGLTNELAILSPSNGEVTASDQVNIRLKGLGGADFVLRVNGAEIPPSRIGARLSDAERNLQALEYVGVQLKAGQNLIEAAQKDGFGNERGKISIQISAPGRAGKLILEAPQTASADGASSLVFTLRLVDAKGLPVTSRAPVTLETASGRFEIQDLNEREPGTQIFIEGGEAKLNLISPSDPGDGLIRAFSGTLEARAKIAFLPALRPLVAVGTLEGGVNFFNFKPQGVSGDLFQDDLKGLFNRDLGNTAVSSRAALFLKGRVSGKDLLTLRYDSQIQQGGRERLFRDIQPDEFYPVYGDAALKGFDAQSSGRFYVRLDRARNSFLFGDFTTASTTQFNTLGNYQRSLNGARTHLESDKYKLDIFGARDNGRQIVDEIRATGTSGGYLLRAGGLLENSERVEIIVRDRNNLGSILEVRPQSRFRDYEFDFATGRLLFRAPVPTLDANFNPLSIRVFYEVETGGPKFWVQGLNGALKITPNLEIGGSLVRDADPQDTFDLKTLSATFRAGEKTTVSGELARSDRDSLGKGDGRRLEVLHEGQKVQARLFAGKTSENFDNPGSVLSRGRSELSLRASVRVDAKTRVLTEAIRTSDAQNGGAGQRTGVQASVERQVGRGVRAELGVRRAKQDAPALNATNTAPLDFTSVRGRLTVPVGTKTNVFGEVESDISDTSRRVLALGGDTKLGERSRIYARHEFISSLDGRFALNTQQEQQNTVIGIDSAYSNAGHLFSEYRLSGALSGREGQAALGVRNAWNVADGVRVLGGFERTKSLGSSNSALGIGQDSTALTGGVEYTRSENLKATTRLELRSAGIGNSILGTIGAAARLNSEFTLLSRGIFNLQRNGDGQGNAAQHRFQLGLAYRDKRDDRWSGLGKYEFRQTKNGAAAGARLPGELGFSGDNSGTTHLFSLDANRQMGANFRLSGHLAAKFNSDDSRGLSSQTSAALASVRGIYDLNRKTEVSAQAAVLGSKGGGKQTGVGLELGRLIGRDLWLSAGYGAGAAGDGDLNGNSYGRRGPYLRIRFKFDESLFGSREAKLLAESPQETAVEPGARLVKVPVLVVDPQTQRKTELPVAAEIVVAAGIAAPQAVEVEVAPTLAPESAPIAPVAPVAPVAPIAPVAPLKARIVTASGEHYYLDVVANLAQDDGEAMNRIYEQTSRARRAGIEAKTLAVRPLIAPRPRIELRPRAAERIGSSGGAK